MKIWAVLIISIVCLNAHADDNFHGAMKAMKVSFGCIKGDAGILSRFRCSTPAQEVADLRNSFEAARKLINVEFASVPDKTHVIQGVEFQFTQLDRALTDLAAAISATDVDAKTRTAAAVAKIQQIWDYSHKMYKDPYED